MANIWNKERLVREGQEKFGNRFDYSEVGEVTDQHTPIKIFCSEHGPVETTPKQHIQSTYGCCWPCRNEGIAAKRRKPVDTFIEEARRIHGDKYNYDKVVYRGNAHKVEIVCLTHGSFWQEAGNHTHQGSGCPQCSLEDQRGPRVTRDQFIQRAISIHGQKYNYDRVQLFCEEVEIECPSHGVFEQSYQSHLQGRGCIDCAGTRKHTPETLLEAFRKKYGDEFGYDVSNYKNNKSKIALFCERHGPHEIRAISHLNGQKCPDCYHERMTVTFEEFAERSRLRHNGYYIYPENTNFSGAGGIAKIHCPKHGEFEQSATAHMHGKGCYSCGKERQRLSKEEFVARANKVHKERYIYDEACKLDDGWYSKVQIRCTTHGLFEKTVAMHLKGYGCPLCKGHTSSEEEIFLDRLGIPNEDRQILIPGTRFRVDAIIHSTMPPTIIEYDGDFWHGNPEIYDPDSLHPTKEVPFKELYEKTLRKEKILTSLGYKVVRVWASQSEEFIQRYLSGKVI